MIKQLEEAKAKLDQANTHMDHIRAIPGEIDSFNLPEHEASKAKEIIRDAANLLDSITNALDGYEQQYPDKKWVKWAGWIAAALATAATIALHLFF